MVQYTPLVGEDAPLDAATALAMRLPARGPGGQAWPTALRLAPLAGELVGSVCIFGNSTAIVNWYVRTTCKSLATIGRDEGQPQLQPSTQLPLRPHSAVSSVHYIELGGSKPRPGREVAGWVGGTRSCARHPVNPGGGLAASVRLARCTVGCGAPAQADAREVAPLCVAALWACPCSDPHRVLQKLVQTNEVPVKDEKCARVCTARVDLDLARLELRPNLLLSDARHAAGFAVARGPLEDAAG